MVSITEVQERFDAVYAFRVESPEKALSGLEPLLSELVADEEHREELAAIFEKVFVGTLSIYVSLGNSGKFQSILDQLRPYFATIPKARTAKLVRLTIQALRKVPQTQDLQLKLCREWIDWAVAEDRSVIRQRLQIELSEILFEQKKCTEAIEVLSKLTYELRKIDHKSQLIEVHLIESRVFRELGDLNRAKASLTVARTNAAAVYISPTLQGDLDLESGILFTAEKEFRNASSYFSEAYDAFVSANERRAIDALKYGILVKILDGRPSDTAALIAAAAPVLAKFTGPEGNAEVNALLDIARAAEAQSLDRLNTVLEQRKVEISTDPVVVANIATLLETLEEQHLLRIVKPFSSVEIRRLAEIISLPVAKVEDRIVQMILDQKLKATINQSTGVLNIFDEEVNNEMFVESIAYFQELDGVVDALYSRCNLLS
jgi:26S proteasome regulatory subunit N6